MESYQFLDSFDWEGKKEPSSPSSQHSSFAEELILEDYDFCNDGLFNNALFDIVVETKPVITSDLLKDNTMVIALPPPAKVEKDQWLGEKLKIPQLSGVAPGGYVSTPTAPSALVGIVPDLGPFPNQRQPVKVQNTEELLMEFDYVYENVELTHLTPPQTPPQEEQYHGAGEQPTYLTLPSQNNPAPVAVAGGGQFYGYGGGVVLNQIPTVVEQLPQATAEPLQQVPGEYQLADSFGFQPVAEVEDIARNLELVEEIIRSRSKDLPDCNDDEDSCSSSEDGSVSSSSCPMSDASSSYCGSAYSRDQDDEWSPSGNYKKSSHGKVGGGVSKKRTRPYGRGIEDKKSRKKEQNKNAATRYRQKKKAEIEEILIVERQLKDKNDELKSKSADIGREIRYLKSLMREVCKAKGLLE